MKYGYSESLRDGLCPQIQIDIFLSDKKPSSKDLLGETKMLNICVNGDDKVSCTPEENIKKFNTEDGILTTSSFEENIMAASLSDSVYFQDFTEDLIELSLGRRVVIPFVKGETNSSSKKTLSAIISFLKEDNEMLYDASLESQGYITIEEYRYHFKLSPPGKPSGLTGVSINELLEKSDNFLLCTDDLCGVCIPVFNNYSDEFTYLYVGKELRVVDVIGKGKIPLSYQKPRKLFFADENTIAFLKEFNTSKVKYVKFDVKDYMKNRVCDLNKKSVPSSAKSMKEILSYFEDDSKDGKKHLVDLQNGNATLYTKVNNMLTAVHEDWLDKDVEELKEIFNTCSDKKFEKIAKFF